MCILDGVAYCDRVVVWRILCGVVVCSVALCSVAYTGWCGVAPNYDCSYAVGGFPHMPRADGSQGGQYIFKHKYSTQIYLNTNLAFIWSHLNITYCTNPVFNINILGMMM